MRGQSVSCSVSYGVQKQRVMWGLWRQKGCSFDYKLYVMVIIFLITICFVYCSHNHEHLLLTFLILKIIVLLLFLDLGGHTWNTYEFLLVEFRTIYQPRLATGEYPLYSLLLSQLKTTLWVLLIEIELPSPNNNRIDDMI